MRGYFLTNMYISPIQHGIQAAHCIHDMFVDYDVFVDSHPVRTMLYEWASDHKTMIILNGGTGDMMREAIDVFNSGSLNGQKYPWGTFNEPSIDNALTCVGIVVPESIYNMYFESIPELGYKDPTLTYDQRLSLFLSSHSLAR